jgi:hypothetical protein
MSLVNLAPPSDTPSLSAVLCLPNICVCHPAQEWGLYSRAGQVIGPA